ncbi:Luminal-binding protein 4 [Linum perenne]
MADFQIAHDLLISVVLLFGCLFFISTAKVEQVTKPETVIGIDLGTTYSCVGIHHQYGYLEIIRNDQGNRITPSCVSFTDREILIGEAAKNQTAVNLERTIFDIKRLIGRKFEDKEVQRHMKLVPYKIVSKEGKLYIEVKIEDGETKFFSPEEISAMIMTKMKETAEALLKKKIKDAVITVPPYFNDAQRQATKDASGQRNILVFHLGGGTCYASILSIDNGDVEVLSTSADIHLGGDDFDRRITDYLIRLIKDKHGKDIISKDDIGKLRNEAERAKRALSREHQVRVEIESLLSEPLSRSQFEKLSKKLSRKAMRQVMEAMQEAKLEKEQIDEIVMVGGSSRIPKVRQLLEDYFKGKKPSDHGVHPDETVAFGASILAGTLSEDGGGVSVSDFMLPLDSLEVSRPMTKEDSEYLERVVEKIEEEEHGPLTHEEIKHRARLVEKVEEEDRNYREKIEMLRRETTIHEVEDQSLEDETGFLFSISTTKVEQVTKRGTVIGIDLGTTYSSVGVARY